MTYSQGGPGYPPPSQQPQPPTSYGAPGQNYSQPGPPQQQPQQGPAPTPSEPGESQLPLYLTIAVAALGLAVYLADFANEYAGGWTVLLAILAGLVAGVGLLPKQTSQVALAAVLAVTGALLAISSLIASEDLGQIGAILVLAFSVIQAIIAVVVLLFDAGVITPPVPRPKYEQYGGYGAPGGYYGQPQGQLQQRPGGYPQPQQPYSGYPQQGPASGGFPAQQPPAQQAPAQQQPSGQHSQQNGPPTPPTGFPQYGQPPAPAANNAPTTQVQTSAQPPAAPPQQSGPAPS